LFPFYYKKYVKEADIIIHHYPNPIGEVSEILVRSDRPQIALYHSDIVRQKFLKPFYAVETGLFLSRMDCIVATSPDYTQTSPNLRRFRRKLKIIPLAVDTNFFTPDGPVHPRMLNLRKQGYRIVLYLGRFAYYKGLEYLIEAGKLLPQDVCIVLVGDGEEKEKLIALSRSTQVKFIDPVEDEELPSLYRGADVFVLPSIARSEAFGLVVCEAMACGVPVITTELGTGTSFHNISGTTGYVVNPRNPYALKRAIMNILTSPERAVFGRNARKRAIKYFSYERFYDEWETLIKKIYAQKNLSKKKNSTAEQAQEEIGLAD